MERKILLNSYIFLQSVCDVHKRIQNAEKTLNLPYPSFWATFWPRRNDSSGTKICEKQVHITSVEGEMSFFSYIFRYSVRDACKY